MLLFKLGLLDGHLLIDGKSLPFELRFLFVGLLGLFLVVVLLVCAFFDDGVVLDCGFAVGHLLVFCLLEALLLV